MSQYGRGVQEMVEFAVSIENRAERQRCAETIITVMANMTPGQNNENFYQSLWDHLAYMSGYKLDVDYPFELTRMDGAAVKPEPLSYPGKRIYQRQYGNLLENTLRELGEMPSCPARDELMDLVANRMKQCLADWNRDAMDENKIAADLSRYTSGNVELPADYTFARVDMTPLAPGTSKKNKKKKK